jgi:uncharacterized RDD family membrane protein YckC
MKCPKCGYLGFEPVERCRNCGYEFILNPPVTTPELPLRSDDNPIPFEDLALTGDDRTAATPGPDQANPELPPLSRGVSSSTPLELPLFGGQLGDDEPLITKASPPRPPLAVRRATPEVPRVRAGRRSGAPMLDLARLDAGKAVRYQPARATESGRASAVRELVPAGLVARAVALVIDLAILALVDMVVIYLTLKICGLALPEWPLLPKGPLLAFLIVQNGGYLVAFTVGGQTIGKLAAGIRVVSASVDGPLDVGHSILRTLVLALLAVPAGLGLLTALFSQDRRGLHDRCAGTRVVRAGI